MKFKAAILTESRQPLVVDEIESQSLEAGQVLVEIHRSGICGAQINEIDATKGPDRFLPHLLGHEGGGIVREIGPGVTHVKEGDHVVMHWRPSQGIHAKPAWYKWGGKRINSGWVTTFSEYSVVSENRLTVVPDAVSFDVAALMGCVTTTAFGIINNDAQVRVGESVVVFGTGGLGLSVIQAATLVSAHPIIAIDLFDKKLGWAKEFGATHTINASSTDVEAAIRDIAGPDGADVIIENTGSIPVIESSYRLAKNRTGKVILTGVPKHNQNVSIHTLPLHFGKLFTGSEGGQTVPHEDIPRYLKLIDQGKLDLKPLISHRFALDEINDGIAALRTGKTKRCMLDIQ